MSQANAHVLGAGSICLQHKLSAHMHAGSACRPRACQHSCACHTKQRESQQHACNTHAGCREWPADHCCSTRQTNQHVQSHSTGYVAVAMVCRQPVANPDDLITLRACIRTCVNHSEPHNRSNACRQPVVRKHTGNNKAPQLSP